jgi:flagellin
MGNGADNSGVGSNGPLAERTAIRPPRNEARRRLSMALSILNNLSAMTAENNLDTTQVSLQNTLTQLSSGSKINSGSDDPAGLSIINGLNANIAALTQSSQNATNGTGVLQTADGALSQVTTLLNQAVTLATEASTSGLTSDQMTALNNEFTSIQNEITNIGKTTTFNGNAVFGTSTDANTVQSNEQALASGSTVNSGTLSVKVGNDSYNFSVTSPETVQSFIGVINGQEGTTGINASLNSNNQLVLNDTLQRGNIAVTSSTLNYGTTNNDVVSGTITGANAAAVVDAANPGTINVSVGGKATSFAFSTTETYSQLATAINNANIGVTANAGATTFTLTDNQNRGDIAVTAGTGDGAAALTALGAPVAGGTGGTAISQFQNATVQNLNTLQGSATNASAGNVLGSTGTNQLVVSAGSNSYTFTTTTAETVGQLMSNINNSGDGLQASINGSGQFTLTDTQGNGNIAVNVANSDSAVVTALFGGTAASNISNPTVSAANRLSVFLSDSSAQGTSTIGVDLNQLDSGHLGGSSGIANNDLLTTSDAQAALTAINQGISNIAAFRGNIGAGVNQLSAASSVMSNEATNLTSAESGISDADIGKTVANMTKYTTLQQTGIAALQQANQASQTILKLLQ